MCADWSVSRGDLGNTGSTRVSGPTSDPELLWNHDAGARVFVTPLVVGDRVYVGTCAQGGDLGCAVGIDRERGERAWMSGYDAMEVRGTPAVAGGRLYLVDLDGLFYVFDLADGTVLESTDSPRATPADGICPLVSEGTVYTHNHFLEARDATSLAVRWETTGSRRFEEPVALDGTTLFAVGRGSPEERERLGQTDSDGSAPLVLRTPFVTALDVETGTPRWETGVEGIPRAPAVVDDTVYVPTEKRVYALDAETGAERWSTPIPSPARSMPAVDGEYVCVGTKDGRLLVLDATTGERLWERTVNDDTDYLGVWSSPTIAGDAVYVGTEDGHLLALYLHTGEELWRFQTEAAVSSNPSVVDGVVYVADDAGIVYALG